jgi:uncharacterized protein (DUF2141 family)
MRITGIRDAKGRIGVALFRDGKGFPSDTNFVVAASHGDIDPQTMTAKVVFEKLPQGVYAAAVLHDEKLTGTMEFDSMGMPLSGFGFSNNPDISMGPPTAELANFKVDHPETAIEVKLIYMR